jgi:type I restriction enzyme S subunit
VRLDDVAKVQNGFAFKSDYFSKSEGVPLLRIRDVGGEKTQAFYTGEYDAALLVAPGDLVVGMDGDFRAARWGGASALLNQRVCRLAIKDARHYESSFLEYVLQGYLDAINAETSSVTVKHLSSRTVEEISLPLPPLAEQRRIVAAMEEHFSRLDATEESLRRVQTKLIAFTASGLQRELRGNWPTVALGDLAELITKGTTPTSVGHRFATSGVLFVKAESLRCGVVDHERCAFITDATHQFLARSQLAENDVLITIAGTLGRTGVVRATDLPANTNQAVSLTRVRDVSIVPWLLTWLNGPQAQMYLTTGGRGIGLQNLNLRQISELPVPIPPEDYQRRIVAEVERRLSLVGALAAATAAALKRSAALRRSILERAFTGKLVPHDPSDEPASVLLERIKAERAAAPAPKRRRRVSL